MDRCGIDENCLLEFLSGTLPRSAAERVEAHFDVCDACRTVVAAWARQAPSPRADGSDDEPLQGPARVLVPGTRIGRYRVLRVVGVGGMGVVYSAHDPELDRRVAVKLLHRRTFGSNRTSIDDSILRHEARALARLSHPHVVAVYDVGTFDGRVFMAMEFIEGRTLKAWLRERPRAPGEVIAAFLAAGRGVAAAHRAGLVHLDFKPDNLMIGEDERVRVVDFGFAHAPGEIGGAIGGTPAYMAPERHAGAPLDTRSDQYSFCVALWEALDGARPSSDDPGRPRLIPPRLYKALRRGLSVDPRARFASLGELVDALSSSTRRGRRALWIAGVALAAVGALAPRLMARRAPASPSVAACRSGGARLSEAWSAARSTRMRGAFAATALPYAEDAFRGASRALDRYATEWAAMQADVCREASREVVASDGVDPRLGCLDDRLSALRTTTDALVAADRLVVEHALAMSTHVPRLDTCRDIVRLGRGTRPPLGPEQARAKTDLTSAAVEGRVLLAAGKYREGLERLAPHMAELEQLHDDHVTAEVRQIHGELSIELNEGKAAEADFLAAVFAAEGDHDARATLLARYMLAWTLRQEGHPEDALAWLKLADAMLADVGADPLLENKIRSVRTLALVDLGRHVEARAEGERALELAEKVFGPTDREVGISLLNLAVVEHDAGRMAEAVKDNTRAFEVLRDALGENHPLSVLPMINIGSTLSDLQRFDEAYDWLHRAFVQRHDVLHLEDRHLANIHVHLGAVERDRGNFLTAARHQEEAIRIYQRIYGSKHPLLGWPMSELGRDLIAMHELDRAIALLENAMTLPQRKKASKPELAFPLGCALFESKRDRGKGLRLIDEAYDAYDERNPVEALALREIDAWRAIHVH